MSTLVLKTQVITNGVVTTSATGEQKFEPNTTAIVNQVTELLDKDFTLPEPGDTFEIEVTVKKSVNKPQPLTTAPKFKVLHVSELPEGVKKHVAEFVKRFNAAGLKHTTRRQPPVVKRAFKAKTKARKR